MFAGHPFRIEMKISFHWHFITRLPCGQASRTRRPASSTRWCAPLQSGRQCVVPLEALSMSLDRNVTMRRFVTRATKSELAKLELLLTDGVVRSRSRKWTGTHLYTRAVCCVHLQFWGPTVYRQYGHLSPRCGSGRFHSTAGWENVVWIWLFPYNESQQRFLQLRVQCTASQESGRRYAFNTVVCAFHRT